VFIDASALCSILTNEDDAVDLGHRLRRAENRLISPLSIWETVLNVARIAARDPDWARDIVEQFLADFQIRTVAIEPEMASIALDAYRRYGKGRHPAGLNFGDCFAYACARHHNVPLLYKGDDFSKTDVLSA
jgi:ribonuclease VapC